jgi:hypothetical protein
MAEKPFEKPPEKPPEKPLERLCRRRLGEIVLRDCCRCLLIALCPIDAYLL